MLNLNKTIQFDEDTINHPNISEMFDADDQRRIANHVYDGFSMDREGRLPWERRKEASMELAMQIIRGKSTPWVNASNVAFPLITIAALQFHSQAYPALLQGTEWVKSRVVGDDPKLEKRARADRISKHMSYQVMEENEDYEDGMDRLLINIPIVGCAFKKTYFNPSKKHNASEFVMARDLVLDYYASSVESCNRKSHILQMTKNQIYENCKRGLFVDVTSAAWFSSDSHQNSGAAEFFKEESKNSQPGVYDSSAPFVVIEQHCFIDLDGDGYEEPYIVTIEESSRTLLRIVARITEQKQIETTQKGEIIRIIPDEYFTKYGFIPSPDGSIYDMGFGDFLGPLNESVNSIINQLVDAGSLANSAGGFFGRGTKLRGGELNFTPFGWNPVDSTGDDLRKNIVPFPVREPSSVLFELLTLLINYSNRICGATDIVVGENPGQNTPAQTTQTMVDQGQKVYKSIYKRIWKSMKQEFKKFYRLNSLYLPEKITFGSENYILREDYKTEEIDVLPAADPFMINDNQKLQQAMLIKQAAATTNGYNVEAVERNFLAASKVEGIDILYPGPSKVQPLQNPKVSIEQMKQQSKAQAAQMKFQEFQMKLESEKEKIQAEIDFMKAETAQIIASIGDEAFQRELATLDRQHKFVQDQRESHQAYLKLLNESQSNGQGNGQGAGQGNNTAPQQAPMAGMEAGSGHEGIF